MARPVDIVRKIAPKARKEYLAAFENGDHLFRQHGITTRERLAEFLAQIMAESGQLRLVRESGSYSASRILQIFGKRHSAKVGAAEARRLAGNGPKLFERVYGLGNPSMAKQLGNTKPGDGWKYRGNGLMQTTGRYNHHMVSQKAKSLGYDVDFEANPKLITDARYALLPALIEWELHNLNKYADSGDTLSISRAINLGNPHSDAMPNGWEDRESYARKILPLIDSVELQTVPLPKPQPVPMPVPPAVRGDPEVWHVQRRLKAINYNPGGLDGIWGGMTSGAISGFLNDRESNIESPTSAQDFIDVLEPLKAEISVAETEGFTRPIAPERSEATTEEIGEKIPEVKSSAQAEWLGRWGSIAGAVASVITGITKFLGDAVEWLNPFKTFVGDLPWPVWVGSALIVSAAIYYISRKSGDAKNAATKAFREGSRA